MQEAVECKMIIHGRLSCVKGSGLSSAILNMDNVTARNEAVSSLKQGIASGRTPSVRLVIVFFLPDKG